MPRPPGQIIDTAVGILARKETYQMGEARIWRINASKIAMGKYGRLCIREAAIAVPGADLKR